MSVLAALLVVWAAVACEPATTPVPALREEFTSSGLSSTWHPNRWFSSVCSAGATPGEEAWYRPGAVTVAGGNLVLTARAATNECAEGSWSGTKGYISGWAQTGGARTPSATVAPGYTFTFGRVDVRFRADAGEGLWPAIWLLAPGTPRSDGKLPYPSRPEIDILEIHGDAPDLWRFHLHNTTSAGAAVDPGESYAGPDTSTGFHTASVEWRSDRITWFVDGTARWTYRGPGIPQVPMYLVVNLAVGGWAGTPDPSAFPAQMLIDSIHITP
ncbi:MAG: glycoside hydrolase family 16 protein [Aquihabitans sp.]